MVNRRAERSRWRLGAQDLAKPAIQCSKKKCDAKAVCSVEYLGIKNWR